MMGITNKVALQYNFFWQRDDDEKKRLDTRIVGGCAAGHTPWFVYLRITGGCLNLPLKLYLPPKWVNLDFFVFWSAMLFCYSWSCQYEVWRSVDQQGCAISAENSQSLNNVCEFKKDSIIYCPDCTDSKIVNSELHFWCVESHFLDSKLPHQNGYDTRTLEQSLWGCPIYELIFFGHFKWDCSKATLVL